MTALYGCAFPRDSEAAFSNYRMWESLGFVIAFVYSPFICTRWKIVILMCVLVIGMTCYVIVEKDMRKQVRRVVRYT